MKVNSVLGKHYKLLYILVVPMLASCYFIPQTNRDGDDLANFVKSEMSEGAAIIITPPTYGLTFLYHYDQGLFNSVAINGSNTISTSIFRIPVSVK